MSTIDATTHQTAETHMADAAGVRFAYRRFGSPAATPLLMLQHFRGNLDSWDPALTDALARERELILVDYPGLGASSGAFGPSIADTARKMIAFAEALGLGEVDLLGFSIGGFVAQEIALIRPALVRRLILAATGPKGAPGMHGWRDDIATAARLDESTAESLLHIFFAPTETSRAKGGEFLARFMARREGRDTPTTLVARDAQYDAIVDWGIPDHSALQRLTGIGMPTLIIQGDNDRMIPTRLSHLMAGLIPDAQIRVYRDAAHAFLFQEARAGRRRHQRVSHLTRVFDGRERCRESAIVDAATTTLNLKERTMRSYHLHENTTATPEQLLAAITDFGPGRQEIFGNSAAKFLQVHDLGADRADVTEGTGKHEEAVSWERLAYDWSDPRRVTMKVLDSNVWSTASEHTYSITPQPDGTTDVDVDVVREGKNLKGRLLALVVSTIGKGSLAKALHGTVKAIEARNSDASAVAAPRARKFEVA